MFLSNSAMDAAASEIRVLAAAMARVAAELESPHAWSGDDAAAFQRDWHDQVTGRLHSAAAKLDGISFQELVEGHIG